VEVRAIPGDHEPFVLESSSLQLGSFGSYGTNAFLFVPRPFQRIDDQDTCDASTSEDGSKCVWCSISSFGVCVSEAIAEKMKEQIPGLECDDDNKSDDDAATDDSAATDDLAPVMDDTPPNDDTVPGKRHPL
jgi:hypothetical protein